MKLIHVNTKSAIFLNAQHISKAHAKEDISSTIGSPVLTSIACCRGSASHDHNDLKISQCLGSSARGKRARFIYEVDHRIRILQHGTLAFVPKLQQLKLTPWMP